jgi:segregation and condensation protein B
MSDDKKDHGEGGEANLERTDTALPVIVLPGDPDAPTSSKAGDRLTEFDATVNLAGDSPFFQQLQDRLGNPTEAKAPSSGGASEVTRSHLKGLLEALVFASDHPQKPGDLAKAAAANVKEVRDLLTELKGEYQSRGIQLDEVAGGWIFRTSSAYAPFVRDLTKQKPVRLSRAQVETLAILAYRQPITRPEVDDIRGVDSGPVLKVLLERDLVRILGKKDEPGRPLLYGTTTAFLEFFGLKSLKLGEVLDRTQPEEGVAGAAPDTAGEAAPDEVHDTIPPGPDARPPFEESESPDQSRPGSS